MGTRGAFGVIIGEKEKIAYNHFDSYPDGKGIDTLRWLRQSIADGELENLRKLAEDARVVREDDKPTAKDKKKLAAYTNLNVYGNGQGDDDWYVLMRDLQGDLGEMLKVGYILDMHEFPLHSLFCEWVYLVDLDRNMFEVYKGFQREVPLAGRWAGRPTLDEAERWHEEHLERAKKEGREPWEDPIPQFKAVELAATWPLNNLPSDEHFLGYFKLDRAREALTEVDKYPEDFADVIRQIEDENLLAGPFASEWREIYAARLTKLSPSQLVRS